MLTREQAEEQLQKLRSEAYSTQAFAEAKKLPEAIRQAAFTLRAEARRMSTANPFQLPHDLGNDLF